MVTPDSPSQHRSKSKLASLQDAAARPSKTDTSNAEGAADANTVIIEVDVNEKTVSLLLAAGMARIADDGVLELTERGDQAICDKLREIETGQKRKDMTDGR